MVDMRQARLMEERRILCVNSSAHIEERVGKQHSGMTLWELIHARLKSRDVSRWQLRKTFRNIQGLVFRNFPRAVINILPHKIKSSYSMTV